MHNMTLDALLLKKAEELKPHFKPAFLQRDSAVFQFVFDEGEPFNLTVTTQDFKFATGHSDSPTLTLFVDSHDTCWGLLIGRLDGMTTFMEGRYRADGNIVLSQLLLYLFKSEDPTIVYQVQD